MSRSSRRSSRRRNKVTHDGLEPRQAFPLESRIEDVQLLGEVEAGSSFNALLTCFLCSDVSMKLPFLNDQGICEEKRSNGPEDGRGIGDNAVFVQAAKPNMTLQTSTADVFQMTGRPSSPWALRVPCPIAPAKSRLPHISVGHCSAYKRRAQCAGRSPKAYGKHSHIALWSLHLSPTSGSSTAPFATFSEASTGTSLES